jgi:prepilin-type N-terminal cleavage/methylation domain-containing protein
MGENRPNGWDAGRTRRAGRGATARRRRDAFTLVELLVAIAITLIFGAMAATTLSAGAGMWRDGNRRSYAYDTATVIFQQIQDDLSAAKSQFWGTDATAYDVRVKFWGDLDSYTDPQGNISHRPWMRFVRAIPDFSTNPLLRNAGTDPNAGATAALGWYNLIETAPLRPLEGMCEVAYLMGLGNDGSGATTDPDTLYRAVLAPVGAITASGTNLNADSAGMTFFNADAWSASSGGTGNDPLGNSDRIHNKALPLAQGVIYFEVRYWTQYTTDWTPGISGYSPTVLPIAKWFNNYTPSPCGSVLNWDSTRIVADSTPDFIMDEDQANFGQQVLDSSTIARDDAITDNVFPRSIMVTVTIVPPAELAMANPLRLQTGIDNSQGSMTVIGSAPPLNAESPYVKIDDEWVRIAGMQGNTITVAANGRGVRGTTATNHNAGARVQIGYTFSRIFGNPAAREYWGQ